MEAHSILLVSNNDQTSQLVQMELDLEGYRVMIEKDSTSGFMTARRHEPQILILDMAAPGLSPLEICTALKQTSPNITIILLTDANKVNLLDPIADDYLFKPLSLTELILRVRLNLKRHSPEKARMLRFEDLRINCDSRTVYRGKRLVELTVKEYNLLTYLMCHPQQVIERDRLLEEVWEYAYIGNNDVLYVCMRSLRNKLEANGEPRLIQTVRGIGYVLRAPASGHEGSSEDEDSNLPELVGTYR
ncbi:MAG: response regulator transcription factor [Leptolyngbyaceae cyanobacterium]